jgi:hypothetical protein
LRSERTARESIETEPAHVTTWQRRNRMSSQSMASYPAIVVMIASTSSRTVGSVMRGRLRPRASCVNLNDLVFHRAPIVDLRRVAVGQQREREALLRTEMLDTHSLGSWRDISLEPFDSGLLGDPGAGGEWP